MWYIARLQPPSRAMTHEGHSSYILAIKAIQRGYALGLQSGGSSNLDFIPRTTASYVQYIVEPVREEFEGATFMVC